MEGTSTAQPEEAEDTESTTQPVESQSTTEPTENESTIEPIECKLTIGPAECGSTTGPTENDTNMEELGEEPSEDGGPAHPYMEDIMKCPANEWQLKKTEPVPYKSLDETPHTLVDSKELLHQMITKLKTEQEIALGMKRYTHRSFNGINCLIQLATRREVYLVDTIQLKEEAEVLNEVFASTDILKVGHLADGFIELQKDLGLYLVNFFSLSIAWATLHRVKIDVEKIGKDQCLTTQLKEHCDVNYSTFFEKPVLSAIHQDWHLRPLTDNKIKLARLGVQFLLHIYDKFRNMLIDENLLLEVYQACNNVCRTVWYPGMNSLQPTSHLRLYKRIAEGSRGQKPVRRRLNKVEMEVFRSVYDWRHSTAEKHDEGTQYLLKDDALYRIARALPKNAKEIKECLKSDAVVSPLLETSFDHICQLVTKAVKELSGHPDAGEKVSLFPEQMKAAKKRQADWEAKHKCPKCGKGKHFGDQTCGKRKSFWHKPSYNSASALLFGRPRFPKHRMMRPQQGFGGPPENVPPFAMRMGVPPRPYGW